MKLYEKEAIMNKIKTSIEASETSQNEGKFGDAIRHLHLVLEGLGKGGLGGIFNMGCPEKDLDERDKEYIKKSRSKLKCLTNIVCDYLGVSQERYMNTIKDLIEASETSQNEGKFGDAIGHLQSALEGLANLADAFNLGCPKGNLDERDKEYIKKFWSKLKCLTGVVYDYLGVSRELVRERNVGIEH